VASNGRVYQIDHVLGVAGSNDDSNKKLIGWVIVGAMGCGFSLVVSLRNYSSELYSYIYIPIYSLSTIFLILKSRNEFIKEWKDASIHQL